MKKILTILSGILLTAALLAACSSSTASQSAAPADAATGTASAAGASSMAADASAAPAASGELVLTVEELAAYNGKDGQPAYVAVDGVIYDVTDVPEWANGEHKNGLTAGNDLTDEISQSPHGTSVLADLPVVGRLAE